MQTFVVQSDDDACALLNDSRLPPRFWRRVKRKGRCWVWVGGLRNGYGAYSIGPRSRYAHRVAYAVLVGPIPVGLQLDHVRARGCRYKACVNPAHLEPVTPRVNTRRAGNANARKRRCPRGHVYTKANTYRFRRATGWARVCRYCTLEAQRRRRQ